MCIKLLWKKSVALEHYKDSNMVPIGSIPQALIFINTLF